MLSPPPFPSLVDDVFGQPRVIFARRDGCSNRAHRSRHESSPVHYGRSGGNSTGMRHREYPAARNLFHSRARIGRPRIPPRDGERIPAIMGSARSVLDFQEIPKWYYAIPYGTRTPSKRAILVHLAETARLFERVSRSLFLCARDLSRARVMFFDRWQSAVRTEKCTIWKKGNGEKMKWRTTRRLDAKYPFYVPFMIHEQRIYLCIYRMLKCR